MAKDTALSRQRPGFKSRWEHIQKMVTKIYKIKANLTIVESEGKSFKPSAKKFPNAIKVAQLFKTHNNLKLITDTKNPKLLKGSFSKNKPLGARINILPDGQKLNKAYSLFAPNLTIHDEKSNSHWDAIFQNPNGKFAYLYTLKKESQSKNQKYKQVEKFAKDLPKLKRNLAASLSKDSIALPMAILLKTKMRVGNEIYYKKNHHKGLTTLKKKDIKISKNKITFDYIAKDGVPQKTTETFSTKEINKLKQLLKSKNPNEFVFTNIQGHPFKDIDFEKAFEKYCGHKFYPHIIRSHYATEEAENFLKKNKTPTEQETKNLYNKIADKLGHKKFSKKKNEWQTSYQITLHHYINPKLVEQILKHTIATSS